MGDLRHRYSLQIMQHERQPILFRQSIHALVEHRPQIAPDQIIRIFHRYIGSDLRLLHPPPRRLRFGLASDSESYSVKPGTERLGPAQATGLACQQQKRGLETVLGQMFIVQNTAADAQDKRPMPADVTVQDSLPLNRGAGQKLSSIILSDTAHFGAANAENYAQQAYRFLQESQTRSLPTKIDAKASSASTILLPTPSVPTTERHDGYLL